MLIRETVPAWHMDYIHTIVTYGEEGSHSARLPSPAHMAGEFHTMGMNREARPSSGFDLKKKRVGHQNWCLPWAPVSRDIFLMSH